MLLDKCCLTAKEVEIIFFEKNKYEQVHSKCNRKNISFDEN